MLVVTGTRIAILRPSSKPIHLSYSSIMKGIAYFVSSGNSFSYFTIARSSSFKLRCSFLFALTNERGYNFSLNPLQKPSQATKSTPSALVMYSIHLSSTLSCNKNVVSFTFFSSGHSLTLKYFLTKPNHFSTSARFVVPSKVLAPNAFTLWMLNYIPPYSLSDGSFMWHIVFFSSRILIDRPGFYMHPRLGRSLQLSSFSPYYWHSVSCFLHDKDFSLPFSSIWA